MLFTRIWAVAVLLVSTVPAVADTTATIDVPGSALTMSGDFAGPPDAGGGFTVGVATSAVPVDASKCRAGTLSVDMSGTRPTRTGTFTPQEQASIKRKLEAYALLQNAHQSNATVTLHLHADPKYLFYRNGKLTAPYCAVTIDRVEARHE